MQNINFHIMRASGRLESFLDIITKVQRDYVPIICGTLDTSGVDIIICDDASRAIPETGVGGWAFHAHLLAVYINPDFKDLADHLEFELKSTLAHELNHVTRWQQVGYKYTLLESIIADGLADHFDIAVNGGEPRPWDIALSENQLEKYLCEARKIWNNENYNHADWYFGTGATPRWTGYSMGYKLVEDYIEKSGITDNKVLVGLPAKTFIK